MEVMDATPCITSFVKHSEGDSNLKDSFREELDYLKDSFREELTTGGIIDLAGCHVVLWATL